MKKYVIAFNGPPGCGKDTAATMAATILSQRGFEVVQLKFADGLKLAVNMFCDVDFPELPHEELKKQLTPWADAEHQATFRDAYIAFSEQFAKPLWGEDVFGRILANDIKNDGGDFFDNDGNQSIVYLISDSGFEPEQYPVIEEVGDNGYTLVQIHRDGHTFEGDSRSYISPTRGGLRIVDNNGTLDDLAASLHNCIDLIIIGQNWIAHEEPQGTEG